MALLLAVVLSFVPAFLYAGILYWIDRYEKEPLRLLVGVFLWGAFVATIGAIIISLVFQTSIYLITGSELAAEISGVVLIAPVVEESLKGLAVLLIFLVFRHEFDSVLDGIVYAGIAALGFAATENVLYLYSYGYLEGGLTGLFELFLLRVVLGGWNHAVYTAWIGIGLALARLSRSLLVKVVAPMLGWFAAVAIHAIHNGMAIVLGGAFGLVGLVSMLLVDWVSWVVMIGLILWATGREHRWINTYLREEVERGMISEAQFRTAGSTWAQVAARWRSLGNGRFRLTSRFYQLCAELAQKKHQLAQFGEERDNSATIVRLRAELVQLAPNAAA